MTQDVRRSDVVERKPLLLAISGPAGCGKDTAAQFLTGGQAVRRIGGQLTIVGPEIDPEPPAILYAPGGAKLPPARVGPEVFVEGYIPLCMPIAATLKECARTVFGFSDEQLYGPSEAREKVDPRWGLSPRHVLQQWGTEFGRALHRDVWVRAHMERIAACERLLTTSAAKSQIIYVSPDLRFENELDAFLEAGGHVWFLDRPSTTRDGRPHASESNYAAIRAHTAVRVVPNTGTLDDLTREVGDAYLEMLGLIPVADESS